MTCGPASRVFSRTAFCSPTGPVCVGRVGTFITGAAPEVSAIDAGAGGPAVMTRRVGGVVEGVAGAVGRGAVDGALWSVRAG